MKNGRTRLWVNARRQACISTRRVRCPRGFPSRTIPPPQRCGRGAEVRLLLDQVDSLHAVIQEMGQAQTGLPPDVLMRVLREDCAQKRFVLFAEATGYPPADRAELVAADMVALNEFQGSAAGGVFAHEFDRPGRRIYLPDGTCQCVQRDRVVGRREQPLTTVTRDVRIPVDP